MSTRSCIAYKTGEKSWSGVYCHFDGYPGGVGKNIWNKVKEMNHGGKTNEHILKNFISDFIKDHSAGWSSFPDNCYCHNKQWEDRVNPDMTITDITTDAVFHEWVYVMSPPSESMEILCSFLSKDDNKYHHVLVKTVEFDKEEPDWGEIEKLGS